MCRQIRERSGRFDWIEPNFPTLLIESCQTGSSQPTDSYFENILLLGRHQEDKKHSIEVDVAAAEQQKAANWLHIQSKGIDLLHPCQGDGRNLLLQFGV